MDVRTPPRSSLAVPSVAFLLGLLCQAGALGLLLALAPMPPRGGPPGPSPWAAPMSAQGIGTGALSRVPGLGPSRAESLAVALAERGLVPPTPLPEDLEVPGVGPVSWRALREAWGSLRPRVHWEASR